MRYLDLGRNVNPSGDYEEIEIRAADGTAVRAVCREPESEPRASILLLPRSRPLAQRFARSGVRTVTFDDEARVALVAECVRARAGGHPVVAVGPPPVLCAGADAYVLAAGKLRRSLRYAREWLQVARDVRVPIATVGLGAAFALLAGLETKPFTPDELESAVEWAIRSVDQARP